MGLLTDRINSKVKKSNLINEHALYHEPVPLKKRDKDVTNAEKQGRKQHRGEESVLNSGLRSI